MKSEGAILHECLSLYQAIGGTGIFSQKGMISLENDKNWISFVSTVLPKHIKIKLPGVTLEYNLTERCHF